MEKTAVPHRVRHCSMCPENTMYFCASCPCELCFQCKDNHKKDVQTKDHQVELYRYKSKDHREQNLTDLGTEYEATPETPDIPWLESLNYGKVTHVIESLCELKVSENRKLRKLNKYKLEIMSFPILLQSLTIAGLDACVHISNLTLDRFWVSDHRNNFILTNVTSAPLHSVNDLYKDLHKGFHTVNKEGELIYISRNYDINKLSTDMRTITTLITRTDYPWRPRCIYCSPSSGYLLVGKYFGNLSSRKGRVCRYFKHEEMFLPLRHNMDGQRYKEPNFITENGNGNIVVFDLDSVIVTDCFGNNRFSYTGRPTGSGLAPCGICTDALSQILLCDGKTQTVQIIDENGKFMSYIRVRSTGGLSYDFNTNLLLVGSNENNRMDVYKYLTEQENLNDHRKQSVIDIGKAYERIKGAIFITSEIILHRQVILSRLKADMTKCNKESSFNQKKILSMGQSLQNRIDSMLPDAIRSEICIYLKLKTKQKIKQKRYLARSQSFEHIYALSGDTPVRFLLSKRKLFPLLTQEILDIPWLESLNYGRVRHVIESLCEFKVSEKNTLRKVQAELLKLTSSPLLLHSIPIAGLHACTHISHVALDRLWVSDHRKNLILTNLRSAPLHSVNELYKDLCKGFHTVNTDGELIYIDGEYNINKLSKDMKTVTTLIKMRTDFIWRPRCLYWSHFSGNLLVGKYIGTQSSKNGRVFRYFKHEERFLPLRQNMKGQRYKEPNFITENGNGNIVVFDYDTVEVTDSDGTHLFSYTGHPTGSGLAPCGICTDALLQILLCDGKTHTVQIINKTGKFMSYLLVGRPGHILPCGVSYDFNANLLWVGSNQNNHVNVYKYLSVQESLNGMSD